MKVTVVLNGEPPSPNRLRHLAQGTAVYAADGGAKACVAASVCPERIVGDLDSLTGISVPADWVCEEDTDQNFTDFEKVLRRLPEAMSSLKILGGLGERLDHTWNNLLLAAALPETLPVCFAGERETLWRITPACPCTQVLDEGATVSLLPAGPVHGVCTEGLFWNLDQAALGPGLGLAQSNRCTGPLKVSVTSGILFLCWSHPGESSNLPPG